MSVVYDTFTVPVLASARMVEPIGDKVIPIPVITNHGSLSKAYVDYTLNYGKGCDGDTHNTVDYIYSGVYIINNLTFNDKEGHIFNFGTFSDDVSLDASIWNATLQDQNLNFEDYIGALDGVALNYPKTLYKNTESGTITLTASSDGDSSISGTIRSDFDTTSTSITVLGSRVLIFIFEEQRTISETIEFYTNILPVYNTETRQKLREEPRYKVSKSYQIFNNQYALLDYFAKLSLDTKINLPLWNYEKYFFDGLSVGSSSINYGETFFVPFDGLVNLMLYKDKDNYEVVQIDNVAGNTINLRRGTTKPFEDTYRIVPLLDSFNEGLNIKNTSKYTEFDTSFITNEIPLNNGSVQFGEYKNYYVNDLYYFNSQNREVTQDITVIDGKTSSFDFMLNRAYNDDVFSINIKFVKSYLENYKAWLYEQAGQLVPFWILSYKDEFEFDGFVGTNYNLINVTSYNSVSSFTDANVYLIDSNGVRYDREITSSSKFADSQFQLTLDSVLPSDISVVRTGFLILVRFNTDEMIIKEKNGRTYQHNATVKRLYDIELEI